MKFGNNYCNALTKVKFKESHSIYFGIITGILKETYQI